MPIRVKNRLKFLSDYYENGIGVGGGSLSSHTRCSFFGRVLFSWFDHYVARGKSGTLSADEIPQLEDEYRSEVLS